MQELSINLGDAHVEAGKPSDGAQQTTSQPTRVDQLNS